MAPLPPNRSATDRYRHQYKLCSNKLCSFGCEYFQGGRGNSRAEGGCATRGRPTVWTDPRTTPTSCHRNAVQVSTRGWVPPNSTNIYLGYGFVFRRVWLFSGGYDSILRRVWLCLQEGMTLFWGGYDSILRRVWLFSGGSDSILRRVWLYFQEGMTLSSGGYDSILRRVWLYFEEGMTIFRRVWLYFQAGTASHGSPSVTSRCTGSTDRSWRSSSDPSPPSDCSTSRYASHYIRQLNQPHYNPQLNQPHYNPQLNQPQQPTAKRCFILLPANEFCESNVFHRCMSVHRGSLSRGGLCLRGLCPGGLCLRGLCPGGLCLRGSLSRGSLSRGVSVQGDPLYGKEWAVHKLLECILV